MKIIVHKTLKRSWGPETPYTAIDDNGDIYNGFLPLSKIDENQIAKAITEQKARRTEKVTITELDVRRNELLSEIAEIDRQKEELKK
ncbi:MAG: hypothetical protein J7J98_06910 [candidate division Zixibacteria bacterium]|nr:hypothetical protein [candidate division Zixibacteria bacterium]